MSSIHESPPHQYPQEIQLKLYQAFIFSIPILFSIILFLLFYLFYLKRRAYAISSTSPILPTTINDVASIASPVNSDLKNELNNKLCTVVFDEYIEARDSLCCVCLGEFEDKEELVEVASCKHIFHADCIRHWLHNNATCPLCRAFILSSDQNHTKSHQHPQPPSNHRQVVVPPSQSQTLPPPAQLVELQQCVLMSEGSSSSSGEGSIC